jgi:prophage regulatory protein
MAKVQILRLPEVRAITGLSRATIYRAISNGSFPRSIKLTENSVGWLESDIEAWLQQRIEASQSAA